MVKGKQLTPNKEYNPDMILTELLTHRQEQVGYFVTRDPDFIYLWHRRNSNKPKCISCFLPEIATVKEIREAADYDHVGANRCSQNRKEV